MEKGLVSWVFAVLALACCGEAHAQAAPPALDPNYPPRLFGYAQVNRSLSCTLVAGSCRGAAGCMGEMVWLRKAAPGGEVEVIGEPGPLDDYEVSPQDLGKYLACRHILTSEAGTITSDSPFAGPVGPDLDLGAPSRLKQLAPPFALGAPLRVDQALCCYLGVWQGAAPGAVLDLGVLKAAALGGEPAPAERGSPLPITQTYGYLPLRKRDRGARFACQVGFKESAEQARQIVAESDYLGPVLPALQLRVADLRGVCRRSGCRLAFRAKLNQESVGMASLWALISGPQGQEAFTLPVQPSGLYQLSFAPLARNRTYDLFLLPRFEDATRDEGRYFRLRRGKGPRVIIRMVRLKFPPQ